MKNLIIISVFVISTISLKAQDIHFTQFDNNPLLLNPANSGLYDGNFRFNSNYRNQWAALGNVFETYSASVDFGLLKNSRQQKTTGIGIAAYQDIAGSSKTKTSKIDLSISQTVYLSSFSDLSLGVTFSYVDMSANYNGLNWGSQHDGAEFDQGIASGEAFTGYADRAFDLSAGLLYRWSENGRNQLEIGGSINNMATPSFTILQQEDYIPMRFNVFAAKEWVLGNSKEWAIKAMAFFNSQKKAREFVVGGMLRRSFGQSSRYTGYYKTTDFYFGAYYRLGDAIAPAFKLSFNQRFLVGMSYDITLSKLSQANSFRGGPELSICYISPFYKMDINSPKNFQ